MCRLAALRSRLRLLLCHAALMSEALTPLDRFGGIDGWRRAIRDGTYSAVDFRRDAPSCHWRTVHDLFCGTEVEAAEARPLDGVHYVASDPAAALDAIDKLGLSEGDVLYELGSGLGFVAHLAAFLTRATVKAVEYDPAYHASAKEAAAALGLRNVEHIHADAASLTYDDATAFYLFNPFGGETLAKVITAVERRARHTMIAIAVFGSSRAWHREGLA